MNGFNTQDTNGAGREAMIMTNFEKIALLEEMMELGEGSLSEETVLADIEEWDSMAALSLIFLMSENFGKELKGPQIRKLKTIKDIIDIMV